MRSAIETPFESDNVTKAFGNDANQYMPGPAKVITTGLLAGLHPPKFKPNMVSIWMCEAGWQGNPYDVIVVMRDAAVEWRTVKHQAGRLRTNFGGAKNKKVASLNSGFC